MPREAFRQAAQFFVDTIGKVPCDMWDAPALGEWSVRDLVGHTSRALITIETYAADLVDVALKQGRAAQIALAVTGRRTLGESFNLLG